MTDVNIIILMLLWGSGWFFLGRSYECFRICREATKEAGR